MISSAIALVLSLENLKNYQNFIVLSMIERYKIDIFLF